MYKCHKMNSLDGISPLTNDSASDFDIVFTEELLLKEKENIELFTIYKSEFII